MISVKKIAHAVYEMPDVDKQTEYYTEVIGLTLTDKGKDAAYLASTVDMGWANTPVALAIAATKASLVILYFMHAAHSSRLTWVVILGSFLWLGVLFVLTFADYLTRAWAIY